jgi:hypothetical protein
LRVGGFVDSAEPDPSLAGICGIGRLPGVFEQIQRKLVGDQLLIGGQLARDDALMIGREELIAVKRHPDTESVVAQAVRQFPVTGILQSAGETWDPFVLKFRRRTLFLRDTMNEHNLCHRIPPLFWWPKILRRWPLCRREGSRVSFSSNG